MRQVFLTGLPVYNLDALSLNGLRNGCYVDITGVVGTKLAAGWTSSSARGYHGVFAPQAGRVVQRASPAGPPA